MGKLSCLWEDGVYLGLKATTGEIIIGTERGAWRTRTVQRKTIEERWNKDNCVNVGGVPWRTHDEDPKVDGEKIECRILEGLERKVLEEAAAKEIVPRGSTSRRRIMKNMGTPRGAQGAQRC